jgi:hypothetical protein
MFKKCIAVTALFAALSCSPTPVQAEQEPDQPLPNLIANGSFEQGIKDWGYQQWDGLPVPGRIEKDSAFAGQNYFVLTEPGTVKQRFIRSEHFEVDRHENYTIKVALALQDIPKASAKLRVLQYGQPVNKKTPVLGWARPQNKNVFELLPELEGTIDWQVYTVKLPGQSLHPETKSIAVYIMLEHPSIGELKIDAVSCTKDKPKN